MQAIGYVRVSTDGQELSPEGQRKAIDTKAKELGCTSILWFEDIGYSGGLEVSKRPGLREALNTLKKGSFFIVSSRDRLARSVAISVAVSKYISDCGGFYISCTGRNGDDPESILLQNMEAMFAEYERLKIKQRTINALAVKKNRGEKLGGFVPYGYKVDGKMLIKEEEEQKVIELILSDREEGNSYYSIASKLNCNGVPTRRGGMWKGKAIERICKKYKNAN